FIGWVEAIEKRMTKKNRDGFDVAPDPRAVLDEVTEQLRDSTASARSGGSAGRESGSKGPIIPGPEPKLGEKNNWVYIYTKKRGWVDLPHFTYAANAGWSVLATYAGGLGVEYWQAVKGVSKERPRGYASSAFTFEDVPSNLLGADFRQEHFSRVEP